MAHMTIEYSANLTPDVDVDELVGTLHDAALATGVVRGDALRSRASERGYYAVGDRHPDNAFVAVVLRLGPGRTDIDKHALLDAVLSALEDALGAAADRTMVSVEYQEIDAEFRVNRNHLRHVIAERNAQGGV